MSNLLNTLNPTDNNAIAARKLKSKKNSSGILEAPQTLYKYSLTEKMHEYDNFQKEMTVNAEKSLEKKQRKQSHKGLFVGIAAVAAMVIASLKLTKK